MLELTESLGIVPPTVPNLDGLHPHDLSQHPRQELFLSLDCSEALYGGAAGGGKSDALLMAAAQYSHIPGYHAVIFRRTRPNLQALIDQSTEWWNELAKWNEQKLRWVFPSGAMISFGHMQRENDKMNYKGPAYQFMAFDELTEFLESQYTYMFSRRRRPKCKEHADEYDPTCKTCQRTVRLAKVPLRTRGATNPDGVGRKWVRQRFVSDQAAREISAGDGKEIYYQDHGSKRIPFVPALVEDNPGLDVESYVKESLSELSPVVQAQLRRGDWRVSEKGQIDESWFRYYTMQGQVIRLLDKNGEIVHTIDERHCTRFATVDTAGTSKQIAEERRDTNRASWSVCGIWDRATIDGTPWLILRHVWRERVGWNELVEGVREVAKEWHPETICIESEHFGIPLSQELSGNFQVELLSSSTTNARMATGRPGKVERAAGFLKKLKRGEIFLPLANNDWKPDLVAEWLAWTGDPNEPADQIDIASYAANYTGTSRTITLQPFR